MRVPKAYPIYDSDYREHLAIVRKFVDGLENFQTVGRNGLHRYNNQDHAMLTGMLAVRNLVLGQHNDLWNVNTDQDYHEEVQAAGSESYNLDDVVERALTQVFLRIDRLALGVSLGMASGLLLFLATLIMVLQGGTAAGPTLGLLGQFFPGYRVTALGSLVGLGYGFFTGFAVGWTFAFLRNATVLLYMTVIERRAERPALRRLFE